LTVKKKRKTGCFVLAAAAVIVLIPLVLLFKRYYDYRYVLDDYYYTVVPYGYDITPYRDVQGGRITEYELVCFNADGEKRELTFMVFIDAHNSNLYPEGTFLRVSVSKQFVLGRRALDEETVPEKAREKIKESYTELDPLSITEYAEVSTRRLAAKNTPSLAVSCVSDGSSLIYTYSYAAGARELAEVSADLLDPVYLAQFRADKKAVPELTAIFLEIKLEDSTIIFSQRYDTRIEFDYEKEA